MTEGHLVANITIRPKNVILFGETGVGKSSIINLLAERKVAETSPSLEGCTLEAKEYSFTFPGSVPLNIFDTVGLSEPEMGVNTFFGAVKEANKLIESLHNTGGVDLLVFCVRAGRITTTMQRNYRLFFDILCGGAVPLAIVVTGLEHHPVMEDWWKVNGTAFERYNMRSVAHACITSLPADLRVYVDKRAESLDVLRKMLLATLGNSSYKQEKRGWVASVVTSLRSWMKKKSAKVIELPKSALLGKLKTECMFTDDEAQTVADILTGHWVIYPVIIY